MPIHFLREDRRYTEWELSGNDLERLRDAVLAELRAHAVPFIDRYSTLPELRKTLESPDKADWLGVGLNVDARVTTLAAIQEVEGDRVGALKTLEDGIRALEQALAGQPHELRKRRFDMEYLRKRLVDNG